MSQSRKRFHPLIVLKGREGGMEREKRDWPFFPITREAGLYFTSSRGFVLEKEIRLAPTNQHDGFTTFRRKIRFWLRQDPGRWGPGQKEEKGKQKKVVR